MHIAYVTETFAPEVNGVALTAARTVADLRRRGHRVAVVRPRQPVDRRPPAWAAICSDETADLTTWGVPIPHYPSLRFGLAHGSQLIGHWRQRVPDLVHVVTPGPLGYAAISAARRLGVPVSADYRTHFARYCNHYGLAPLAPAVTRYLRHLHNRVDRSFVPTDEVKRELQQQGFERLQVVGRGIDCERFAPDRRNQALRAGWGATEPGQTVVLVVGRLAAEKNPRLALQAFERLRAARPDAVMVVVGDGPLRATLQHEFPRARFIGSRADAELAACYASADVFAFASLSDSFGNVTLEALASGLVVSAFDTAAAHQHIEHGLSGLLCAPGDDAAFIANLQTAAAAAAMASAPMRQAARRAACELPWERVLDRFAAQLGEVAAGRRQSLTRQGVVA